MAIRFQRNLIQTAIETDMFHPKKKEKTNDKLSFSASEKKQPRLQKAVFMDSHLSRMSNVHNPYDIPLYWLLNRDPYFMTYEIIPLYLGRFSSQKKQQIAGVNWSLLI